ncbi:helix-turn-helix domain-containing protein [Streptococcus agalactiae]|uniref:winged helix-turn-helix transcriptional regulator n=1 Tax=Streptococcus anginosus TaxID=1328 RepID=UPI0021F88C82|nr:helix-turn-helix domain-containing protein [Streptococcus anginosus]MCW1011942.1 helix-turn-helix transcriptional regulator [Streptococcus anginosus]
MINNYEKCPYITTQKALQGKWAIVILYRLSTGKKRFNELERSIPEITRTVLTRQLRQLEHDKLITRKVYAEVPPRVEYSLTDIGQKFKKVLKEIEDFGIEYIKVLDETYPNK